MRFNLTLAQLLRMIFTDVGLSRFLDKKLRAYRIRAQTVL